VQIEYDVKNVCGARTLTLTVKKVCTGSKYNDTCLSEILLRKLLKEKPQVRGAG
jgi:hypothetical protein